MKNSKTIIEAPIIPTKSKKIAEAAEEEDVVKEYKLSWAGKLFFASAAGYILGKSANPAKIPIKVRGTKDQMRTVVNTIVNSKKFQQELKKSGATIESVIDKLRIRNISKSQYKNLTGKNWPI